MSARYDEAMDRMEDVGKKIDAHLKSSWGRTFLCTVQQVRESATVALMGIRVHLRQKELMNQSELLYQRKRCDDVRYQILQLYTRGDKHHAHILRKILVSYKARIDEMLSIEGKDVGFRSGPLDERVD